MLLRHCHEVQESKQHCSAVYDCWWTSCEHKGQKPTIKFKIFSYFFFSFVTFKFHYCVTNCECSTNRLKKISRLGWICLKQIKYSGQCTSMKFLWKGADQGDSFWQAANSCKETVVLEGCTALELASAVHTDTLHLLSKPSESLSTSWSGIFRAILSSLSRSGSS